MPIIRLAYILACAHRRFTYIAIYFRKAKYMLHHGMARESTIGARCRRRIEAISPCCRAARHGAERYLNRVAEKPSALLNIFIIKENIKACMRRNRDGKWRRNAMRLAAICRI